MKVNNEALYDQNVIIIDVRTKEEYDHYHIEHAINIPIFTHEEREEIGIVYKNDSQLNAKKLGVKHISYKIENIMNRIIDLSTDHDKVIVYCQRGGMRSGTIVSLLNAVGQLNVFQLEGGIKQHRHYIATQMESLFNEKTFVVLHGHTGVGKTKLLLELEKDNKTVLDYEGIARNAGSVFGTVLYVGQPPTQKQFEEKCFDIVKRSNTDIIFMESESRRVGTVLIPLEYMEQMNEGRHILIQTTIENRIENLISDYNPSENHVALIECINHLRKRISNDKADELIDWIKNDNLESLVKYLLEDYYDPMYQYSIGKHKYELEINYKTIAGVTDEIIQHIQKG